MSSVTHVLVVDDDRAILQLVSTALRAEGYRVSTAQDGEQALEKLATFHPDAIVLDLTLPGRDGLSVCREVRQKSEVPIIILSAQEDEARKVQALDMGADDYLTKPFGVPELRARLRAVLRRARQRIGTAAVKQVGTLRLDTARRRVHVGNEEISLTPTEWKLLAELVHHAGRVLTHDMLLLRVWGEEYVGSSQYLHIYIGRLRQKLHALQGAEIVTESGVGYWLRPL